MEEKKELEEVEVQELEDGDLEDVAGGLARLDEEDSGSGCPCGAGCPC